MREARFQDAQDFQLSELLMENLFHYGEPGLLLGMFYTPDWRWWRDVTAHANFDPPGAPSAADLDAIAAEETIAHATEKAEAT